MHNPRQILRDYGVNPVKSLGQNFMHDPNTLEKIVASAEIKPDQTVLEIGPGTGALTEILADVAGRVIAIEIDERLQPILEERFQDTPNVYFMFNDILKTEVRRLVGSKPYRVVANVPYYITSAILKHLLESSRRPERLIVTMQYEVAERIIAEPGDMTVLSVSVQYYGKPKIMNRLKPAVFWPRPEIDSAILCVDTYSEPIVDVPSDKAFFRVVKAGFSLKRKQLKNALGSGLGVKARVAGEWIMQAGLDPQRRAQTLTLEEWAQLTRTVNQELDWE